VAFGAAESFEWLDLWLACTMDSGLSRMPVQRSAVDNGLVRPQFGWGAMAVVDKGDLAYLTLRPAEHDGAHEPLYEVGVIGHGTGGAALADRVVGEIRTWDRNCRSRPVRIEIQASDVHERTTRKFAFDNAHNGLVISWD
jgi:protein-L-isoaspartate(D-aspartate) O-methyltransferase